MCLIEAAQLSEYSKMVGMLILTGLWGCAPSLIGQPVIFKEVKGGYLQEVLADEPISHWRLNGDVMGAVKVDTDKALGLASSADAIELKAADFGGDEVAVEMWIKDCSGPLLTYRTVEGGYDFRLSIQEGLVIDLAGGRRRADFVLDKGQWHLLGVSWRNSSFHVPPNV